LFETSVRIYIVFGNVELGSSQCRNTFFFKLEVMNYTQGAMHVVTVYT